MHPLWTDNTPNETETVEQKILYHPVLANLNGIIKDIIWKHSWLWFS